MFTNYFNTGITSTTPEQERTNIRYLNRINLYGGMFLLYAIVGFMLEGFHLNSYASIINLASALIPLISFLLLKSEKYILAAFVFIIGLSSMLFLFGLLFGPYALHSYFLLIGIGISLTIFKKRNHYIPIILWLFFSFIVLQWHHSSGFDYIKLPKINHFFIPNSIVLFFLFTLTFHHFIQVFNAYNSKLHDKNEKLASLLEDKILFEQIINHSSDAYLIIEKNSILYANKALCLLFGFKLEEVRDKSYEQVFSQFITELIKKHKSDDQELSNKPLRHETILLRNNKDAIHVNIAISALRLKDKTLHIITFSDITESKKKESIIKKQNIELQKVLQTKEKFFSVISHDLRSPFTGILGLLETLTENYHDMDKAYLESILHKLLHSADNYYSFLDTLLIWTNVQNGTTKPNIKALKLNGIVDEIVDLYAHRAQTKNIHIIQEVPENCTFHMDGNFFSTILRNFISNSLKFTPESGLITISVNTIKNKLVLSVEDNGVGMDAATIDSLLNKNDSISTFGTAKEKGTGIGLALCKDIIKLSHGKLHIESGINVGTKFTVAFKDPTIEF